MNRNQDLDFEKLVLIAGGHSAFQLLWAGIQLGVFDLLAAQPGVSLQAIADSTKVGTYPARVLMVGLTALGLINKHGTGYRNARLTDEVLVTGKPKYVGDILGWQAQIVYPGQVDFVDSLRQGRNVGLARFPGKGNTLYERLAFDPALEVVFQKAMAALSAQALPHLLDSLDFSRYNTIVDAGGGGGANAIALARKFPNLKVIIFDSPTVCELAIQNIQRSGLTERLSVWKGNFFEDPFPSKIDAVLYCHMFTIWSLEQGTALLNRTCSALPEGGDVILFNMMGNNDDSGPLSAALGSPYFLSIATGHGMLHSWADYEGIMHAAGLSQIRRVDNLPLNHGIIVGTK